MCYERKLTLMWRLLDNDELDGVLHEEIYQFVKVNLSRFREDISKWYGSQEKVLSGCEARVERQLLFRSGGN